MSSKPKQTTYVIKRNFWGKTKRMIMDFFSRKKKKKVLGQENAVAETDAEAARLKSRNVSFTDKERLAAEREAANAESRKKLGSICQKMASRQIYRSNNLSLRELQDLHDLVGTCKPMDGFLSSESSSSKHVDQVKRKSKSRSRVSANAIVIN